MTDASAPNAQTPGFGAGIPAWAMSAALVFVLGLIYSPSFTIDYLTLDETAFVGRDWRDYDFYYHLLAHGRLLAIYRPFVYEFAGYDADRIQLVRFAFFLSMALVAVLLQRFLRRESGRPFFAFFTTLFLFSQLPFQTFAAFSLDLISYVTPTIFLSLAAFWLHFYFFPRRQVAKWLAHGLVLLLLVAAMQSTQTWAFFAMVPLAFLVLAGPRERLAEARTFLLLAAASIVISMAAFQIGLAALHQEGREGYQRGEDLLKIIRSAPWRFVAHSLNPMTYWGAFKLWTLPFPLHTTPPSTGLRQALAVTTMGSLLALALATVWTELRGAADRARVVGKWLAAVVCLGFGALVLLAESPWFVKEARPHLTLVMSGVLVFIAAYSLLTLSSRFALLRTGVAKGVAVGFVLLTAVGAQSGLLRAYVDVRADQLDFIRTELSARRPHTYDRIVVIFAPRRALCATEPCDDSSGQIVHRYWHARRPERYWYAMETLGLEARDKEIVFVREYTDPDRRDLVVDWRKFYRARKRAVAASRRG